ncbi:MAG: 30S ribosomal protein S2 [Brevinematia bacterium]
MSEITQESQIEIQPFSSEKVNINVLLEAGAHFGHQKSKWNPKMKEFIFATKGNVHIINLQKTLEKLKDAYNFVKEMAKKGAKFLFVGTRKQAQDIIKQEAVACGQFYVNKKWIPGTLTNFHSVRKAVQNLMRIEKMEVDGSINQLPKSEISKLMKLKKRLSERLEGIRDMKSLPDVLYVVDITKEEIAVNEARKLGIPIVAIVDTNSDPTLVDYPIPANDDAVRSIQIITEVIKSAILEGESFAMKREVEEEEEVEEKESYYVSEKIAEEVESLEDRES